MIIAVVVAIIGDNKKNQIKMSKFALFAIVSVIIDPKSKVSRPNDNTKR